MKSRSPKKTSLVAKSANGKHPQLAVRETQEWDSLIPVPKLTVATSCTVVAILAVLCYANSAFGDFVFDDSEAIEGNKDITQESPVSSLLVHDFWGDNITKEESHKSYRPLTVLTFRWTHYLAGGLSPFLFHLTNILLHAVVSALSVPVFAALMGEGSPGPNQNTILRCPRASFLCALIFAVHPIHSESVAAVVGRADLLCALFFLLSFLYYISACQSGSMSSLLLCSLFCAISMLCKEPGITVLGVCSIYDLLFVGDLSLHTLLEYLRSPNPFHRLRHHTSHWRATLSRHTLLLATGVALIVFRYTIMGSSAPQFTPADNPASFADSLLTRVVNYNYHYALNGWLLLNPMNLCFDWSMGCIPLIHSLSDLRILAVISFWLVTLFFIHRCAIHQSHQFRIISMAIAVLIITFLPASNIFFRVGFVIAERNLYLPSIGFIMLIVTGVDGLARSCSQKRGTLMLQVLLLLLTVCFMGKSIHRSYQWSVDEELYKSGLNVCPLNAKVHYNIAKAAADRGRESEAVISYREAIRLHLGYDHALNNLANLLKEDSQTTEAEDLLKRAVTVNPAFAAAWMNLGIVQASLKKYSAAERSYEQALAHRKRYPDCYFNLGNLYILMEEHNKALNAWLNATSLNPHHSKAWQNCLSLLDNLGELDAAVDVANEALKHLPADPGIHFILGNVLGKADKFQEAESSFLRALRFDPAAGAYHGNIAVLYHQWGKLDEAEHHYKRALELAPGDAATLENYNKLRRVRAKQKKAK